MIAKALVAIGEYLGQIDALLKESLDHDPEKLAEVRGLLMSAYALSVRVFIRPRPMPWPGALRKRCIDDRDCNQDEECDDGICVPISAASASADFECWDNRDCNQDEECIDGICVPIAFQLVYALPGAARLEDETHAAIESYFALIHDVYSKGLTCNPDRLAATRDTLMKIYADAYVLSGRDRHHCDDGESCPEGEVCVNGICVPRPYSLGFGALGSKRVAPWAVPGE